MRFVSACSGKTRTRVSTRVPGEMQLESSSISDVAVALNVTAFD
jgi:hypothetical protein